MAPPRLTVGVREAEADPVVLSAINEIIEERIKDEGEFFLLTLILFRPEF